MKIRLLMTSAVFALLVMTGSASAGGRYPNDCGSYGLTGHIKSKKVGCHEARNVIGKFYEKSRLQGADVKVHGFACHGKTVSGGDDVFCTKERGGELIHYRGAIGRSTSLTAQPRGTGDVPGSVDSWCSGGNSHGDAACTAIIKRAGKLILSWATSRESVSSYVLCVTSPTGKQRCQQRNTQALPHETVGDAVIFQREFPHNVAGTYAASWRSSGRRIGPVLHFAIR